MLAQCCVCLATVLHASFTKPSFSSTSFTNMQCNNVARCCVKMFYPFGQGLDFPLRPRIQPNIQTPLNGFYTRPGYPARFARFIAHMILRILKPNYGLASALWQASMLGSGQMKIQRDKYSENTSPQIVMFELFFTELSRPLTGNPTTENYAEFRAKRALIETLILLLKFLCIVKTI